uniref:Uncharacterized protein n=1 Tax=Acrobeloides nanus TaxID=290746 RepID=A0A914C470_9BILA
MDSKQIWSSYSVLYDCPSTISQHYPYYNLNVRCTDDHTFGYVNATISANSKNTYPLTDYGYNCCKDKALCSVPNMPGLNGSSSNVESHILILCIMSIFMAVFK